MESEFILDIRLDEVCFCLEKLEQCKETFSPITIYIDHGFVQYESTSKLER